MNESLRIRLQKMRDDWGQKASTEAVDALKCSESEIFGQSLDSERGPLSTTNPLKTKALDSVGQFGQSKQVHSESDDKKTNANVDQEASHVGARVRVSIDSTVQTVQTVQNSNKVNENNNLTLDSEPIPLSNHCPISDAAGSPEFERIFWTWLVDGTPDENSDQRAWRQRYRIAIETWTAGRTLAEARQIGWGVMQTAWHRQHGKKTDPVICGGCGQAIADRECIEIDGARFHSEGQGDAAAVCLVKYADAWRGAADAGLQALGLIGPPAEIRKFQ